MVVYADVANQGATFTITKTKSYVPIVTLSTQDNAKFFQLKSGFKGMHVFFIRKCFIGKWASKTQKP